MKSVVFPLTTWADIGIEFGQRAEFEHKMTKGSHFLTDHDRKLNHLKALET